MLIKNSNNFNFKKNKLETKKLVNKKIENKNFK